MDEDWDALWSAWFGSRPGLTPEQQAFMDSITAPSPLLDDAVRYTAPRDERPLARVLPFRPKRREG